MLAPGSARSEGRRRHLLVVAVFALLTVSLLLLIVEVVRARSFEAERHRRALEIVSREPELYRQLSDRDGVLESQRQIYMERFRRLEAKIRQNEQEIDALRARLTTVTTSAGVTP
jgi:type II secretory pathway component PulM